MSEEYTNCSDCKIKDICPKHAEKCAISGYEADYQTIVISFKDKISELEKIIGEWDSPFSIAINIADLNDRIKRYPELDERIESLEKEVKLGIDLRLQQVENWIDIQIKKDAPVKIYQKYLKQIRKNLNKISEMNEKEMPYIICDECGYKFTEGRDALIEKVRKRKKELPGKLKEEIKK